MVLSEVKDYATNWPILIGRRKMRFSPKLARNQFKNSGYTVKVLAKAMYPDTEWHDRSQTVAKYLNGQAAPKLPVIRKMADALGCDWLDLCEEISR